MVWSSSSISISRPVTVPPSPWYDLESWVGVSLLMLSMDLSNDALTKAITSGLFSEAGFPRFSLAPETGLTTLYGLDEQRVVAPMVLVFSASPPPSLFRPFLWSTGEVGVSESYSIKNWAETSTNYSP